MAALNASVGVVCFVVFCFKRSHLYAFSKQMNESCKKMAGKINQLYFKEREREMTAKFSI